MSGIAKIQRGREDTRPASNVREARASKEIWFKDGDQAFATSVATGDDNDKLLDQLELYTFRQGNRFANLLKDDDIDASAVPEGTRASHKFAFWAYVHEIIHADKRDDAWEEVQGPSGRKLFKETVEDFKVIGLSFGRSDYLWNQLVDVHSDWGSLNKGVLRIKRTGTGMYDTSYTISVTARQAEVPKEALDTIGDLPTIKDYYKERYGALWEPSASSNESEVKSENVNNLF
jgi:hypothetical protein|tara:strand:+ start:4192 stop:4887 length:696 start_codon:yes stop_codon:yes gene_type:complete